MTIRYLQLLCSNCSNPEHPEYRQFTYENNTLTCEHCGRTLKVVKPSESKDSWTKRVLYRNKDIIDKSDYIFEVEHEGKR